MGTLAITKEIVSVSAASEPIGVSVADSTTTFPVADIASSLLTGLVAYWSMNEVSGTRHDANGNYNLADNGTHPTPSASGLIGLAADFTASQGNRLKASSAIPVSSGAAFTFAGWLYPGNVTGNTWFTNGGLTYNGVGNFDLADEGAGPLYIFAVASDPSDNATIAGGNHLLTASTFNFVRAWFDPATNKTNLLINEANLQTAPTALPDSLSILSASDPATFSNAATYMTGLWTMAGWWNRLLTTDEAATLYNSGAGKAYPF